VIRPLLLLPALLLVAAPVTAEDHGLAVFEARCASCHAVAAGALPGAGPNLAGVVGRRVGGDPGFDYSPVLEEARQEGRVWDAALLERFLADPEEMFPGLWMGGNGLRAAEDRAAVAAFLRTAR
jgi:cytochrome c